VNDRRRHRHGGLIVLALALACPMRLTAQQMQVIDLHYRRAEEVIPVLEPLLAPGDALTGVDDKLFLRADPATTARIEQALAVIDRKPRELVVTVGQGTVTDVDAASVRGSATVASGDASVGINRPPDGTNSAQVTVSGRRQQANLHNLSSVRVTEGTEAFIQAGQSVPYTTTTVTPGWAGSVVTRSTTYQDVGTGFYVTPRLNGDVVTLIISPRQQALDRAHGGTIRTAGTSTTVTAKLGEWVPIGAVAGTASGNDTGLLVWGQRTAQSQYSAWLKVEEAP
jgi:type II secretory pathway component GspD/PulD (secretin)